MASPPQSQGAAPSSRRNSSSLNPNPTHSQSRLNPNLETPEDDYNYHDAGPSISPTNPKQLSTNPHSVDASEEPERFADELRTTIFEKAVRGNRAKVPDDPDRAHVTLAPPNGQPTPPPPNTSSKRSRRRFFNAPRLPMTHKVLRSAEETFLWQIGLYWSREGAKGDENITLNARILDNNASAPSKNSIMWQWVQDISYS